MNLFKTAAVAAASLTAIGSANAATFMVMDSFDVDLQRTNFDVIGELQQFDPSLGQLQKVTFMLEGTVQGTAEVESLDAGPSEITANLSATITLNNAIDPGNPLELVVIIPTVDETFNATAFDGTFDFAGTSGATFDGLMGMDDETTVITDPADFVHYIGVGTFAISIDALGSSSASGAGNLIARFETLASATAKVIYEYRVDGAVPVPGALVLMGTALAGFGASRRKRAA